MSSVTAEVISSIVVIVFILLNCKSGNFVLAMSTSESLTLVEKPPSNDHTEIKSQNIHHFDNDESATSQFSNLLKQGMDKNNYYMYNLEDFCNGVSEKAKIHIGAWKAAIFQVGFAIDNDGSRASRKIHKCKIDINADENFWLVASIEHMKIRGRKDSINNKWQCSDYVQFSSPGNHLLGKVFSFFDVDVLNDRESEKLCGEKKLDYRNIQKIIDMSTDANSFSTASKHMSLFFHQDDDEKGQFNNSFKIVVTTFQHASDEVFAVACEKKQKCYGGSHMFCIDPSFICDGHVNCAFPGSGTDEQLCLAERPTIFNMTTVIIITLLSVVGAAIVICVIITVTCRIRSRIAARRRAGTSMDFAMSDPSAPRLDHEGTLPPFDTVISSASNHDLAKGSNIEIGEGELPPKYETLFPQGPPQGAPPQVPPQKPKENETLSSS